MCSKRILLCAVVLCVATLYSIASLAQQGTDCRRSKDPPAPGTLDLTGDWTDNSVNLKVKITQVGTHPLNASVEVQAKYEVPYKCAYPSDVPHDPGALEDDFTGQMTKQNLGAHSEIAGEVSICMWQTKESGTFSRVVQGKLSLIVGEDGNSMSGSFEDPVKGTQNISFTRLSKPDTSPYDPAGVIKTTTTANIYHDPSNNSEVAYTAPPGTQLIFEEVILDAAGNPTWYRVVNGEGPPYSKNTGFIPATQITCDKPNIKGPATKG